MSSQITRSNAFSEFHSVIAKATYTYPYAHSYSTNTSLLGVTELTTHSLIMGIAKEKTRFDVTVAKGGA